MNIRKIVEKWSNDKKLHKCPRCNIYFSEDEWEINRLIDNLEQGVKDKQNEGEKHGN